MARYKDYSYEQGIMIPVDFTKDLFPQSWFFDHTKLGPP